MGAGSSPILSFTKDPTAVLDYTFDWRKWLGDDTIATVAWTVPAGIANAGSVYSTTTTTIWLSGGTAGVSYSIYVTITTTGGRTDKRTFKVNGLDR
jgi:hypothetical protein